MGRVNVIPVVGDGNDFGSDAPQWRFSLLFTAFLFSPGTQSMPFSSLHKAIRVLQNARRGILLLFALTRTLRECVIASGSLPLFRCGPEGKKLIFSACWMLPSNEKDVYVGCSIRSFSHLGLPA